MQYHGRIQNEEVRGELVMNSILDDLEVYRKHWKKRVRSMPTGVIPIAVLEYKLRGRGSIGNPGKRWKKSLSRGNRLIA